MTEAATLEHPVGHHAPLTFVDPNVASDTNTKVSNWKMFMWLFLAQDAMTFFTMFAAYLGIRIGLGTEQWTAIATNAETNHHFLSINETAVATFVLICSSVTMVQSLAALQRSDMRKFRIWLACTVLGGVLFLCFQYYEYSHLIGHAGMGMGRSLFDATFFVLTSFHGLHVFCGVVYLASVLAKSHKYSATNYVHVEILGLYWHFVDLVWIILFTLVYLI